MTATASQPVLPYPDFTPSVQPPARSRFEEFLDFHRDHPEVYRRFRELTLAAADRGLERLGARLIWERLRWEYLIELIGGETPKLIDHHAPYYARLVMLRDQKLAGLFVTKDSRFDTNEETLLREANRIDGGGDG